MTRKKPGVFNTINARILLVLTVLFVVIAAVVGEVNNTNIRGLYEESYTERLLLTNALMGSIIKSEDVEYFADLMRNQDDAFKERQVTFYHDREELFRLQREEAPLEEQEVMLDRLALFHNEMESFKNEVYWSTLNDLRKLKQLSSSTYVYVMADTGLQTRDGEPLYTYIFDAEDGGDYDSPDMDGLGTSDVGNEAFTNVFLTKKQTGQAEHYEGDFGELYFVCVPILNEDGEVVAILGTDLALDDMNSAISRSIALFNSTIIVIFVVSVIIVFALLSRSIAQPLGSLTATALSFAEGNLHTPISETALRQRTEIGTLAQAIRSTLNATTLYLNSIPEGIFIMNREYDTLFRNEQFIGRFGDMRAREFMLALFPENTDDALEQGLAQQGGGTAVWIDSSCFAVLLKEIILADMPENSILVIANDITDLMNEKDNAQAAAHAKSNFMSRMSHEMRTPMNAIIGMAKVAESSDNIPGIKHCISIINSSSSQLLSIINDVLDMSAIDAGKFELEHKPMNIEKTLTKACSLVLGDMEKKKQRFNVVLSEQLGLNYIADDLRLSQVLTNLLLNAVKFTPETGTITLTVESAGREGNVAKVRFSVSDTGIGMTGEQISRLFNAFEQADGGISRKYGGTGLGLAISQSIVGKMGGLIEVDSQPGTGTTFYFTVNLECMPQKDYKSFGNSRPEDIRLLIVGNDDEVGAALLGIAGKHGIPAQTSQSAEEAIELLDSARGPGPEHCITFICDDKVLGDKDRERSIILLGDKIGRDSIVIITSYLECGRAEKFAYENNITNCVTKPIFPSAVLNAIDDILEKKRLVSDSAADGESYPPDLTGVRILLAEDIEINREVFLALVEDTNIVTDIAVNGLEAVSKFNENPDVYDLILMDIQMPEMDGYEATRAIREAGVPRAGEIPIVAMSANAFKEDVERCLKCGMNDHLAKPIDVDSVLEKIILYSRRRFN